MSLLTKLFKLSYGTAKRLPALAATAGVGWLGYSALRHRESVELPDPFASHRRMIDTLAAGRVAIHESRTRSDHRAMAPILLVHSVNAAASSYEMRPLFQHMERERHVVAMDLPGFAHSERGNRPYSPELMADAIAAVLDDIGSPTHVVALSLASEFAARAASIRPDLVASLTFISPTGMGRRTRTESKADGWSEIALANTLLGQGIFDLLATLPSIDYFLSKSFAGDVDAGLRAFAKLSAEQPEARHAPLAFLKGGLFTPDAMNRLYQPLAVPTLVLYDQDAYTDFANLPEFVSSGGGRRSASRVPNTRGLPQFDDTLSTASAIDGFWNGIEDR